MLVVDASVLAKAIVSETDSSRALGVLAENVTLIAPMHCLAEVAETVARKIRVGDADLSQIEIVFPNIARSVRFLPIDRLVQPAMRASIQTNASVYDCLYVALAAAEDCPLVTADRRLIAKMAGTGFAGLLLPLNSFNPAP